LPLIAGALVGDGFKIAVVKWTADANAVNIARSGSDTINGATSAQIGSQYSQIIFVADGETNTWFASQSGLGATNVNIDNFSGNNSTVAFTLTSDPSTENNTAVYIDGVYQQKNTYSVAGTTLTFSTAPPTGTTNIEVAYATPLAIGTPSDGTVTAAKIVDGAITLAKLAATGTRSATTFLAGDDTFKTVAVTPTAVSDQANSSTGYFDLPAGTTAQRPGSPDNGMMRYNSTLATNEIYQGGTWNSFSFSYQTEYLVVAGGGGGGGLGDSAGGGGGAGGLLNGTITVSPNGAYTVTVGAGGGQNTNGSNSVYSSVTATGGGYGGKNYTGSGGTRSGNSGGSGGGAAKNADVGTVGGTGTSGQGYNGGGANAAGGTGGGGGGGATAVGEYGYYSGSLEYAGNGGAGSNAFSVWATATSTGASGYYAGGGGAGVNTGTAHHNGVGGAGGGATAVDSGTPSNATANTGGGGAGGIYVGGNGSSGGSGIVIIRYAGSQRGTGGTVVTTGGYTYHTFTSSSTFTA
jgi:hypothetical protein